MLGTVARGILMCGMATVGAGVVAVVSAFSARACADRVGAAKSKASDVTARRSRNRMMAPERGDVRGRLC